MDLKSTIRHVPDFPKPGILFYDITTLLKNPLALKETVDQLTQHYAKQPIDLIAGIESRGFIFGLPLAYQLGLGFIPIRKPGKLPAATVAESYALEYGHNAIELHVDAISAGQRVLIVDDLLATGGTARAACNLVEKLGGQVAGLAFAIELNFLHGRDLLTGYDIFSLLQYDE